MKDHKLVPLRPPESILAVVRKAYGNATAYDVGHVWHEIYTGLPDAAPVQEPSHDVVAGAIFDFAGFLTTHKDKIEVGSNANAEPMVERIREWADKRGLLLVDADVCGWHKLTAQPRKAEVSALCDEIERLRSTINEFHHAIKDAGWYPGRTDDLLTDIIRAKGDEVRQLQEQNTMLDAKLVEVEKDAARYVWLRDGNDAKHGRAAQIVDNHYGLVWDDLIDLAMEDKQ